MSKGAQAFIGADEVQYSELRFWIFEHSRNRIIGFITIVTPIYSSSPEQGPSLKPWNEMAGSVNSIRISIGTDWTSISFEPEFFINSISLNS